jgi:hypothetical protein
VAGLHGEASFTEDQPYRLHHFGTFRVAVAALNSTIEESHREQDHQDRRQDFTDEVARVTRVDLARPGATGAVRVETREQGGLRYVFGFPPGAPMRCVGVINGAPDWAAVAALDRTVFAPATVTRRWLGGVPGRAPRSGRPGAARQGAARIARAGQDLDGVQQPA